MRRLLALVLCISLLGALPVYAEDAPTEPTEPVTAPTEPVTAPVAEPTEPALPALTAADEHFIGLVDNLPEAAELAAFAAAQKDFSQILALAERDMPLPKAEIRAYEAAFAQLAATMGVEADPVYPDTAITPSLQGMVQEAMMLQTSDHPQVLAAREQLSAAISAYPALAEDPTAKADTESVSPIRSAAENIQMHLFNYGPKINTPLSGYGFLPFIHSEGAYGWAVDSNSNSPAGSSGSWPVLKKVLSSFPYVAQDKNSVIRAGSLSYLFDPAFSGTGRVSKSAYLANISTNSASTYNPYQYGSVYLKVNNSDGSGTGLFRKEGRYFVYDSGKNAAWYNPSTGKFQLYPYVLRPAYTPFSTSATNGNFLPFNLGHTQGREDYQAETYTKEYSYVSGGETVTATAKVAKPDTITAKPGGARTAYRLYGNTRQSEVDLWFGMDLQFDFYQPLEGLVDGQAMEFEFLGDDDVFVFIDGVLILDIGGTHGAQAGRIDFATGKVTNPASYGQLPTSSTLYELMKGTVADSQFTDSDGDGALDTFRDLTKHRLQFYYLERGGNVSYCRLKFNMDPLPVGSMSVEKQVTGMAGNIREDRDYTFTLSAQALNDSDAIEAIPYTKYSITAPGDQVSGTIPNGGSFTLAHQEKIVLKLDAGTTVTVTEEADAAVEHTQWSGPGEIEGRKLTYTIPDGETEGEFICTNTRKTGSLTLTKSVSGKNFAPEQSFSLRLSFNGKAYTGPATLNGKAVTLHGGAITLKDGGKVVLSGIPTGCSYTLTEEKPGNDYRYHAPEFGGKAVAFGEEFTKKFQESHTLKIVNRHVLTDVTVKKAADGQQDFLFRLTGGTERTALTLVVPAGGSVTVKDLPAGNVPYAVTEVTDWAWRYTLAGADAQADEAALFDQAAAKLTFTLGETDEVVTFRNTRTEDRWLGGDTHCENRWDGENGAVRRERGT